MNTGVLGVGVPRFLELFSDPFPGLDLAEGMAMGLGVQGAGRMLRMPFWGPDRRQMMSDDECL